MFANGDQTIPARIRCIVGLYWSRLLVNSCHSSTLTPSFLRRQESSFFFKILKPSKLDPCLRRRDGIRNENYFLFILESKTGQISPPCSNSTIYYLLGPSARAWDAICLSRPKSSVIFSQPASIFFSASSTVISPAM